MAEVNVNKLGIVTLIWAATDESGRYGCIVGMIDANGKRTTSLEEAHLVVIYDATTNNFEAWSADEMRALDVRRVH